MKQTLLSAVAMAAISLAAHAQAYIPNSGFEAWGNTAGEDQQPQGWISYNVLTSPLLPGGNSNPTSVTQAGTPDNYQGNYSARIETVTLVSNPDTNNIPWTAGALFTGSVALTSPYMFPGYGSQQRPSSMSYAAKYAPMAGDSGFVMVSVTRWNGSGRDSIAFGYDMLNSAISSYAVRTVPLVYNPTYVNTIPDTISIMFSASTLANPQAGSVLWVDAVAFSGYVGMDEYANNDGVAVYPNPSSTFTQFDVVADNASQVVVFDMTGREVARENFYGKTARVKSLELANGSYTYNIVSGEAEVLSRGQFAVAH